jgi:DNA-binding transcriptional LysR family regulator
MDIRLLRVFKSVVDCGGMAASELELNIGTSTISRHIKDLETRLGLTLCRRGRGGFTMTAEGERIYEETLRLLASAETASTTSIVAWVDSSTWPYTTRPRPTPPQR